METKVYLVTNEDVEIEEGAYKTFIVLAKSADDARKTHPESIHGRKIIWSEGLPYKPIPPDVAAAARSAQRDISWMDDIYKPQWREIVDCTDPTDPSATVQTLEPILSDRSEKKWISACDVDKLNVKQITLSDVYDKVVIVAC